jgi:hypothetical protein
MPTSSGFQINEVLTAQNTNTYLLRAGRNCIINGAMNIAQRATSVAGITVGGYYTADRWYHNISASGTWTDTVQSISASDAPNADGLRNTFKMTCTTATGALGSLSYNVIAHNFEGINVQQFAKGNSLAKYFALSFWIKSNAVGTYIAELYDHDNQRTVSASYTIASSGVWQKVRLIFPADSIGGFDNDANMSMTLNLWFGAGSGFSSGTLQTAWAAVVTNKRATGQTNVGVAVNNYVEITGVQLEPNAVCTPFELEDVQVLYAKCWRYFQRHFQPSMRGVTSNSFNRLAMSYPPMRAQPTGTSNGGLMGFYNGATAVVAGVAFTATYLHGANTTFECDISSGGWGTGSPAVFYQGAGYTFAVDLSAELI